MPVFDCDYSNDRSAKWRLASEQVRAKFPALIEGSSGWNRAVQNRFRRLP